MPDVFVNSSFDLLPPVLITPSPFSPFCPVLIAPSPPSPFCPVLIAPSPLPPFCPMDPSAAQLQSLLQRENGGGGHLHVVACTHDAGTHDAMRYVASLGGLHGTGMSLDLVAADELVNGILAQVWRVWRVWQVWQSPPHTLALA
eukprot:366255-Chlamydomonas_euryale.AAC.6